MSFCFRNINCPASVPQQDFWIKFGAGEGIRTLDFNLGKVAEYELDHHNPN